MPQTLDQKWQLQHESMSSVYPPLTKDEYALRRDLFGYNSKAVTGEGKLSNAYYGPRVLDEISVSQQKMVDIKNQYAPPALLDAARQKPYSKKFDIPIGIHGCIGTGNTVKNGVKKNGLTAEQRKFISAMFHHHLHYYVKHAEEKIVAKVVERQFRHAIATSPAYATFFASEATANEIIKRISNNFRKSHESVRRSGRFSEINFSTKTKTVSKEMMVAATWTELLKRPKGLDVDSLERPTDGARELDAAVSGGHAYDCGPSCVCIKSHDVYLKPRNPDGSTQNVWSKKISGTVAVPNTSGKTMEDFVFPPEKICTTLIERNRGPNARAGLKKEVVRMKLKKLKNQIENRFQEEQAKQYQSSSSSSYPAKLTEENLSSFASQVDFAAM